MKPLAIPGQQHTKSRLADPGRLLENCVEDRYQITGRGVDHLQHFGDRGLLGPAPRRARPCARRAPRLSAAMVSPGINLCVVGHRLGLARAITCDDTPLPLSGQQECAGERCDRRAAASYLSLA